MQTLTEILENTIALFGKCPGCGMFHTDPQQVVTYLQWLSDQSMINFN
jgi:hypothetical protein